MISDFLLVAVVSFEFRANTVENPKPASPIETDPPSLHRHPVNVHAVPTGLDFPMPDPTFLAFTSVSQSSVARADTLGGTDERWIWVTDASLGFFFLRAVGWLGLELLSGIETLKKKKFCLVVNLEVFMDKVYTSRSRALNNDTLAGLRILVKKIRESYE